MYQTVNNSDFHAAFVSMGRGDQFSHHGRNALFDWLIQMEDDTGEQLELDVISLCCEFVEYPSAMDAVAEYDHGLALASAGCSTYDEDDEATALYWLCDHTTVIEFDGGIIIQAF